MTRATALIIASSAFLILLLVAAIWGARRTHNAADFLVASRRLNMWLTAMSHTGNAVPAWLMFVVVGAAFEWGIAAIWIAGALLLGTLVNWFYVAPRLRRMAVAQGNVTILQIVGADAGERLQPILVRSGAFILIVMLLLLVCAQLNLIATVLQTEFRIDATTTIITVALVVSVYVAVGGYWAASLADAVLLITMLLTLTFLLIPAAMAADGWTQLRLGFQALGLPANDWFAGRTGVIAIAFTVGVLAFGVSLPGQPHALSRFIASRDETTLRVARWWSLAVLAALCCALLLCGWCAQVLYSGLADPKLAPIALAMRILPPGFGSLLVLLIMGGVAVGMSGYLAVIAGSVCADLKRSNAPISITVGHVTTVIAAIVAVCITLYAPANLLDQGLLAYTILGAAFGPLVLVRVSGKRIRPGAALGAMWAGTILTLLFHLLPDAPGDFLERVLPFVAALGIALTGGERRSNPDRADRAQETVHDRVPI